MSERLFSPRSPSPRLPSLPRYSVGASSPAPRKTGIESRLSAPRFVKTRHAVSVQRRATNLPQAFCRGERKEASDSERAAPLALTPALSQREKAEEKRERFIKADPHDSTLLPLGEGKQGSDAFPSDTILLTFLPIPALRHHEITLSRHHDLILFPLPPSK